VRQRLEASPHKSLRKLSAQTGKSKLFSHFYDVVYCI
jgi:hypothetical protein